MSYKEIEIETADKDGNKFNLIFSKSFCLINKNDSVTIKLPKELFNWTINFKFEDSTKHKPLHVETIFGKDSVTYILYRWYSEAYVENSAPFVIFDTNKTKELFIKIRTAATSENNLRLVIVSLWEKIKL